VESGGVKSKQVKQCIDHTDYIKNLLTNRCTSDKHEIKSVMEAFPMLNCLQLLCYYSEVPVRDHSVHEEQYKFLHGILRVGNVCEWVDVSQEHVCEKSTWESIREITISGAPLLHP
jgi:hypothetical protein